ncbi:MAG: NAD(P)/FAD-dependent oxidoreductase [Christiangramia sp.]|nr:pyridine nucleotide-disulfide oxidoreductase [Christiangramia sp.]
MNKEITDILIIGAGPSGTIAAGYLEKKEVSVLVVEKEQFPRFTIGESLIPRVMDNLAEAGLLDTVKKQQYQKKFGARFIRGSEEAWFDFSKKYGKGWDWTWQVPRDHFDHTLALAIEEREVPIWYQAEVLQIHRTEEGWEVLIHHNGIQKTVFCRFIIDASGNGRVLTRQLELEAPAKIEDHSSVFTQISEVSRPEGPEGEQISFEILNQRTWFWYIPFSNGNSSLGFVAPNQWFEQFSKNTSEAFQEMLEQTAYYKGRFDQDPILFEPIKIQNISKNVSSLCGKGFALTGNSAEFLDPVFSSGVAFATESGLLAAKLAFRELQGEVVNWETEYSEYIRSGVKVFSTYVKAWYDGRLQRIFFSKYQNEQIKEQICAVLAGYVWDKSNPFVRNHERLVNNVALLAES